MSNEHLEDEKLQAFYDGELTAGEADAVRRAIEASDVAQAQLAQLGRLSDLLQIASEDVSLDLPADDMFAKISSTLGDEKRLGRNQGGLRVIEGGKPRSVRPAATQTNRARWGFMAGAGAIAAAAVMAFYFAASPPAETARSSHPDEGRVQVADLQVVEHESSLTTVEEDAPHGSEVVEFDFGHNSGTIFHVEGDLGQPLAVVWIDDGGSQ